jgi:hypothetical protein
MKYAHIDRLKCNRESPCDACVRRNKQASCKYADNANRDKPQSTTKERLENLENKVLHFMQKEDKSEHLSAQNVAVGADHGMLHSKGGQLNYIDSSHWRSILNDIKEVREQLSIQDEPDIEVQPEVDLVFGPQPTSDILQSLPSRPVCDGLLSQYFNATYMILRKSFILADVSLLKL